MKKESGEQREGGGRRAALQAMVIAIREWFTVVGESPLCHLKGEDMTVPHGH